MKGVLMYKCRTVGLLEKYVKFMETVISKHPENERAKATAESLRTELKKLKK